MKHALLAAALLVCPLAAAAACPNQAPTVTIPYPTGTATVSPVDATTCNALNPMNFTVGAVPAGVIANPSPLSATSSPALTADAAGLHFSANGAAFAAQYTLTFTYQPNAKSFTMTATVGGPATPVGTTTTP
jgi:hypothetical protein